MTVTADTAFASDTVAGSWTIDPSHSEVGFTVRHLMSKVRGQFEKFEGTLTTGDSLEETRAAATIDLNSVNTRDEQRDAHLRSADFFDVEKFGQMTFTTTSFDGTTAVGELTIKGVTKPVELDVEFLGSVRTRGATSVWASRPARSSTARTGAWTSTSRSTAAVSWSATR